MDAAVAEAFATTSRVAFVDPEHSERAEEDTWLPTGPCTTISQPSFVARVISAARIVASDRVLEIGASSGRTAAILAKLAAEVVSVDCVPELVAAARVRLANVPNVQILQSDGDENVDGTFDVILVIRRGRRTRSSQLVPGSPARRRPARHSCRPTARRPAVKYRVLRVTRSAHMFVEKDLFSGDWNLLRGKDGFKVAASWREV